MRDGPMTLLPSAEFGPPPKPSDNANHEAVDDKWWQESAVFSFTDASTGFGSWIRFGMHLNQGVSNLYTWTVVNGEMADRRMMVDQPLPEKGILEATIAGASVTTLEPLMRYHITLETEDLKLDVVWTNFRTPLTMGYNVGGATIAKGHYNAIGEAVGTGVYRGKTFTIKGQGFTDHSWGVRRSHLPASRSMWATFGEDFYLMAIPISTGTERTMVGYAYKDGVLGRLMTESEMGYSFRDDWITPSGCDARLLDDKGRMFNLRGQSFGPPSTWPMGHGKLVTHASAGFLCEGRIGSGILESAQFKGLPPAVAALGLPADSWWINEGHA